MKDSIPESHKINIKQSFRLDQGADQQKNCSISQKINQPGNNFQSNVASHQQRHIASGEYLKSAVYGGTDGVINCLAVIIGGIASRSLVSQIVSISLSVIIGDGIGMALGDYMSAKSEKQFIQHQSERETWEVENCFQQEKLQMQKIYSQVKYTKDQAKRLTQLISTNKKAFVNIMMLYELGLVIDRRNPIINGAVTFFAFVIFGTAPLIPYLVGYFALKDNQTQYLWTVSIGCVQLFFLGFIKQFLIGMPLLKRIKSGVEQVVLATVAVAGGFGIGKIFEFKQ